MTVSALLSDSGWLTIRSYLEALKEHKMMELAYHVRPEDTETIIRLQQSIQDIDFFLSDEYILDALEKWESSKE